uniref:Potassium channel domain-containing protein n=1 Tax=Ditylenchus dipsaci TaxID=166011 RepID=A0A915D0N4_9BILA
MFQLFRRFRWLYKKLRLRRLRYGIPLTVLAAYTVLGAYIFRHFELEIDEERRRKYRESTEYAFNQVLARMQEVRCEDKLVREDHNLQARHTKDALFWLIDYLNLTQVIEERSESSPWTWIGSMFYAGQLYTTIGYGLPACQTDAGRIATMAYIMVGIPIFLLILAEVGKWLSRALRKFYKRLRNAQQKLPEVEDMARKMSEPVKVGLF